ncbi:MAG: hypothetical protein K1X51_17300 [Rhodospirillaceae bacterium]|nr:hypothetical protein [Rhodospirillaceae bacterium]
MLCVLYTKAGAWYRAPGEFATIAEAVEKAKELEQLGHKAVLYTVAQLKTSAPPYKTEACMLSENDTAP